MAARQEVGCDATEVVWEVFTEVLRRLGADRVNFVLWLLSSRRRQKPNPCVNFCSPWKARLYATGISMGAAGVWDLAIRYGDFLAAVAPIAGRFGRSLDKARDKPVPRHVEVCMA